MYFYSVEYDKVHVSMVITFFSFMSLTDKIRENNTHTVHGRKRVNKFRFDNLGV